ncbi:MAG: hypothetical protein MUC64_09305 [Rubritepida sp.]|nr:hypothetical protein [Rubritepida sp.]
MLLPALMACAEDPAREAEALTAAWQIHSASQGALGAPAPATAPAAFPAARLAAAPALPVARPLASAPLPTPPGLEPLPVVPRGPAPAASSELMGAPPEVLLARLGPPQLRRQEGDAQVWLYAGRGCQLDLILYPTPAGPRVAHAQARAGGVAQRTEGACLRELAAERPAPRRPAAPTSLEPAAAPDRLAS